MAKRQRERVQLMFDKNDGKTEQCHVNECDIEYLLKKHGVGFNTKMPDVPFTDLTDLPSYQECLNVVQEIGNYFSQLPLDVRKAFDHDPALLMAAVEDPARHDELVQLGLFGGKDAAKNGQDGQNNGQTLDGSGTNQQPAGEKPAGSTGA